MKTYKIEDTTKRYLSVDEVEVVVSESVKKSDVVCPRLLKARIASHEAQVKEWKAQLILVEAEAKKGTLE